MCKLAVVHLRSGQSTAPSSWFGCRQCAKIAASAAKRSILSCWTSPSTGGPLPFSPLLAFRFERLLVRYEHRPFPNFLQKQPEPRPKFYTSASNSRWRQDHRRPRQRWETHLYSASHTVCPRVTPCYFIKLRRHVGRCARFGPGSRSPHISRSGRAGSGSRLRHHPYPLKDISIPA